jgi:hypothetical protein
MGSKQAFTPLLSAALLLLTINAFLPNAENISAASSRAVLPKNIRVGKYNMGFLRLFFLHSFLFGQSCQAQQRDKPFQPEYLCF